MAYQNLPRFNPNYGNRYGFRQKPIPPIAEPGVGSATSSALASASDTRLNDYSGTSAESSPSQTVDHGDNNDNNQGPGTTLSGNPMEQSIPASYASPTEAWQYGKSAYDSGYYGSVGDAARANQAGNLKARGALQGFLAAGPTGEKKAPGTLGYIGTKLDQWAHGGAPQYDMTNIYSSLDSLSKDGGDGLGSLYSTDIENNSSGYFGDTTFEQQTVSDLDAAKTFGDYGAVPTVQQLQGPEIFHDPADDIATQVAEQQANYDHYQDNSSDDNHGQTDGSQTGGETSHAGGYGGYADDTAATNNDSGGGGGGK